MSASLVGSEMCIRDRLRGCRRSSWSPRVLAGPAEGLPARMPPLREESVSYTHLTLPTICSV
eukprot:3902822-Alexandrium_andersonii.AAC.1